ncbi:MAG: hypothetical protein RR575_03330 [Acinetobacter sp.]
MIKKIILLVFVLMSNSHLLAKKYILDKDNCVFTEVKNNSLFLYSSDCKKNPKLIDNFEVPNGTPNVNFISQEIVDNKKYILLSTSYSENYRDVLDKVGYSNGYNIINFYDCNSSCKLDSRISDYFGSGGDMENLTTGKIVHTFPYKNLSQIRAELKSKLFQGWIQNKFIKGEVTKKTNINEVSNYTVDRLGCLVIGDKFKVKDISSGWLNIIHTNKNGRTTTGWIVCKDTDLCNIVD